MITRNHVHIDQALKTPQFYLLWLVLFLNVTTGNAGVPPTNRTTEYGVPGSWLAVRQWLHTLDRLPCLSRVPSPMEMESP